MGSWLSSSVTVKMALLPACHRASWSTYKLYIKTLSLCLASTGGHSIDSPEPIFGLVVAGLVDPARVKRNSAAHAGDVLILTKPLGVGVMTTALKKGVLPDAGYEEVGMSQIRNCLTLNAACVKVIILAVSRSYGAVCPASARALASQCSA